MAKGDTGRITVCLPGPCSSYRNPFVRTHTMQGVTLVSTHSIDTENQSAAQCAVRVADNQKFNAFLAAMLGLVIVFGVGFAPSDLVHNAAHDGRHSLSVPCH